VAACLVVSALLGAPFRGGRPAGSPLMTRGAFAGTLCSAAPNYDAKTSTGLSGGRVLHWGIERCVLKLQPCWQAWRMRSSETG